MKLRDMTFVLVMTVISGCASAPEQDQVAGTRCDPDYGGAAVGALAGGVLGAQVGRGSGRDAAIAAGAATGALVGSRANCP